MEHGTPEREAVRKAAKTLAKRRTLATTARLLDIPDGTLRAFAKTGAMDTARVIKLARHMRAQGLLTEDLPALEEEDARENRVVLRGLVVDTGRDARIAAAATVLAKVLRSKNVEVTAQIKAKAVKDFIDLCNGALLASKGIHKEAGKVKK